jgi:hypothetical protein
MVAAVESPVMPVEIPLVDKDAVEAFLLLLLPYVYGLAAREQRVRIDPTNSCGGGLFG